MILRNTATQRSKKMPLARSNLRRGKSLLSGFAAVTVALTTVFAGATTALATPSVHEITANWAGDPATTEAPYGQPVIAEWRVNTNDAQDPYANENVDNVRATLSAGNGVFNSIPTVCKTANVDPVSEILDDGLTLLCNIGTVKEGTSTLIQTPVRATGLDGGDLTLSGTATSDSAVSEAGPADPGPLPITYSYGMDLSLDAAPAAQFQGAITPSRTGGDRVFLQMNFSLILKDGSRPGPADYTFPVKVSSNNPAGLTGLQWEGCVPISSSSPSTGQPYSDPAEADRTNFPECAVTGSGADYTVSLSDLDYTLVNTPNTASFGDDGLPAGGAYIASGTVQFSVPSRPAGLTNYTFAASPPAFSFPGGTSEADTDVSNNISDTTLPPAGTFNTHWAGQGTQGRSAWDSSLWVSPGSSEDIVLPHDVPGGPIPLYQALANAMWNDYDGPGGEGMAGSCILNQNPAFMPRSFDSGMWAHAQGNAQQMTTLRYYYSTKTFNTKTETCGNDADWIEAYPEPGTVQGPPTMSDSSHIFLPDDVTGVRVTWNPGVDKPTTGGPYNYIRVYGYIDPAAPTAGEGWVVGTYKAPTPDNNFPTTNGWTNASTKPGGADLPGSTYGPNMNGFRDAFRLQGPEGIVKKTASDTTAQPGVPVTYTLEAQVKNSVPNPPQTSLKVTDTLPAGMEYVTGSATPEPTSVNGNVLTWALADVTPNELQTITYQAQIPADGAVTPGTRLTNTAVVEVPGDNRPVGSRSASATVLVPSSSSTALGKSTENNLLSFFGDTSAWVLTINSQDPDPSAFTDTIDVLPQVGDGRGTNIDGTYKVTGVTAPTGSTVYYTSAPFASVNGDPRDVSNGTAPGSIAGNTVGWSTDPVENPTAIRVIGPELAAGGTQTIRIAYETPRANSCEEPADGDNKPGQLLVNSATSIAEHTELPMLSSATATVGSCYSVDLKKYVQDTAGEWRDANEPGDYPQFRAGDTVTFRIVVKNIGQGTVTNLEVSDDLQPELGAFTVESLARGETETHEYSVVLEDGGPDVVINTACGSADVPADGDEPTIICDPAGFEVVGDPTHEKSLVSAAPIGNGQWELVYGIDVTNTSAHPTVYTLDDTLHFTDQASVVSANVTVSPEGVELADPAWDGKTNPRIATSVPLVGKDDTDYTPHRYEVTVVADVPLQLEGTDAAVAPTECGDDGDESDRAFNNTSALTKTNGDVEDDQACAPIPSIEIAKSVSTGPTPNGDGTWTVTYDVVATNTGHADGVYDVTDRMTADGDLEVVSAAVVSLPDGVTPLETWTGLGAEGGAENVIASDVTLPAGGTHTYGVDVVVGLAEGVVGAPIVTLCAAEPGANGGLSNTAEIEHNELTDQAGACVTVGVVTVEKTVAAGPTPNDDGTWTVVYDIDAHNVGGAAADYDVTDRLHFGEGIEIVAASVVTAPDGVTTNADWTGLGQEDTDAQNVVARNVTLAAGATHTYQVEVTVQMDEATIDPTQLRCAPPGTGTKGGLGNSTTLVSNGVTSADDVCPGLPLILLDKELDGESPVANGDGTWTITYDVTASNIGSAAGDYDMSDKLRYGDGIDVKSATVLSAPEGVELNADWTGQGETGAKENVLSTDVTLDAGGVHTYQVQVVAAMDQAVVTPASLTCPTLGSSESGGFANSAALIHNGETQDDEACVEPPLIEITKSLAGAVVPVDDEAGVYDASYEITVTNRAPGAGVYDLDDRLTVGKGVTVVGTPSVSTDAAHSVGVNPNYGTDGDIRLVTAQPIAGAVGETSVQHRYLVTVRYSLDLSQVATPAPDTCVTGTGTTDGTLNNVAEVKWNGIVSEDTECIIPGQPTLDKALVSAAPAGEGKWEVVYDLVVGNTGNEATTYDLDDEFLFAPAVTVDTVTVKGPEGAEIDGSFNGVQNQRIVTDHQIVGLDDADYVPHVYRVTVIAQVPLNFNQVQADGTGSPACTTGPGSNFTRQGLNNAATLTDATGHKLTDTDCAELPSIDITKSIVGSPSKDNNGDWTITYEISASNDGAESGMYSLTDQLRYGAGIEVVRANVTQAPENVTPEKTWTGMGEGGAKQNIVASDVVLNANETHIYQVTVVATLDTDAADASTLTCPDSGSSSRGGFANTASLEHNDLNADADACATPDWPQDVPPPLAVTGADLSWTVIITVLGLLTIGGGALVITRNRLVTGKEPRNNDAL